MFSIGQTLRIRVGPLKGYLCRVIAVHKRDVTVKLDSQQKVLTGLFDVGCDCILALLNVVCEYWLDWKLDNFNDVIYFFKLNFHSQI